MNVYQTLQLAVSRHQAGNLADAEKLYRQVLAAEPNNSDAIHLLGVLAHQDRSGAIKVAFEPQAGATD